MSDIIHLYADKFRSQEGLPPDYRMNLLLCDGQFLFGVYAPVLSHLAGTETLALFGCGSILLSWPHEVTAAYLRE